MNYKLILLIFVSFAFTNCRGDKQVFEINRIIKEWTGKTIVFSDIEYFCLKKEDSLSKIFEQPSEYKILLYVDSAGCTSCRLHLDEWKAYIEELGEKTSFLLYFHPKHEKDILLALKIARFNYPVYIDKNDELNRLNKFPANPSFQCFLLNKNNKVIAIGNPTTNYKIWELYKQIITGEISDKPPVTVVVSEQTEVELNDLQAGKTSEAIFVLKNTGTNPLVIQRVESSCGCTVPDWEKQPITAGNSTEIKVKITPEKSEYFNKTVTVHCNTEEGQISFIVKGTVK
jgi:hypothetical protein